MQLAHFKLFIPWSVLPNCHESSDWCCCFSRSGSGSQACSNTNILFLSPTHSQMLPLGKVMCIICLVAPLPPQSKYKHDSQQAMALNSDSRWRHTLGGSSRGLTGPLAPITKIVFLLPLSFTNSSSSSGRILSLTALYCPSMNGWSLTLLGNNL